MTLLVAGLVAVGCLREELPGVVPGLIRGMELCIGVPAEICRQEVRSLQREGRGGLVAWRITCEQRPACTPQSGLATVEALFGDGSSERYQTGWRQAEPPTAP